MGKRSLTMKRLYNMKHELFEFNGVLREVLDQPEKNGIWLIWGAEKNGKTWFTLILSDYLSQFEKVYFVSGEEGIGANFQKACSRAKISPANKRLVPSDYEPLEEVYEVLKRRNAPKIVVLDNITIYNDELKNGGLRKLLSDFPEVLFLLLAHEDRGEPYTATAKLARRLAKVIYHVDGLKVSVSGRCPGGELHIDAERSALYHGEYRSA